MLKKWFNKFLDKRSSEPDGRAGTIRLTGLVGIAANVLFALAKLLIGFTANSISIMSDAVNNLTDAVSSVITLVGLKLSMRPPDKEASSGLWQDRVHFRYDCLCFGSGNRY